MQERGQLLPSDHWEAEQHIPRPLGLLSASFTDSHQTSCNLSLHFIPIILKRETYSVSFALKLWMARKLSTFRKLFI